MIHRNLSRLPTLSVSHNPGIDKRVMLGSGELPAVTNFSQAVFAPGDVAPIHHHSDMWEVFFVRSGTGSIRVDETTFPLVADDCFVVQPGEEHEIANDSEGDLVLLYFGVKSTDSD